MTPKYKVGAHIRLIPDSEWTSPLVCLVSYPASMYRESLTSPFLVIISVRIEKGIIMYQADHPDGRPFGSPVRWTILKTMIEECMDSLDTPLPV